MVAHCCQSKKKNNNKNKKIKNNYKKFSSLRKLFDPSQIQEDTESASDIQLTSNFLQMSQMGEGFQYGQFWSHYYMYLLMASSNTSKNAPKHQKLKKWHNHGCLSCISCWGYPLGANSWYFCYIFRKYIFRKFMKNEFLSIGFSSFCGVIFKRRIGLENYQFFLKNHVFSVLLVQKNDPVALMFYMLQSLSMPTCTPKFSLCACFIRILAGQKMGQKFKKN